MSAQVQVPAAGEGGGEAKGPSLDSGLTLSRSEADLHDEYCSGAVRGEA